MAHQGVALDDPRNQAILGFLKPPVLTAVSIAERLVRINHGKPPANLTEKVAWIMSHPKGTEKPPSQSFASVVDPLYGLGTHPDLVTRLWKLNEGLPKDCRWVVYGRPALVHPLSGIIFAYATGTLGYAIRLPASCCGEADRLGAKTRLDVPWSDGHDLAPAGPEWRFGKWFDEEGDWCRAAYEHACASGEIAP